MKKYKIIYWQNGDKKEMTVEAEDIKNARYVFYMYIPNGDIISIIDSETEWLNAAAVEPIIDKILETQNKLLKEVN